MSLADKTALVTGAGAYIPRAVAIALAQAGARIMVADSDLAAAERTAAAIREAGGQASAASVNVRSSASCNALIASTIAAFGHLDVFFEGQYIVGLSKPAIEITDAEWRDLIAHDLDGPFYLCRALLPHMMERRAGVIVLTASGRGVHGGKNIAAYAAAKGGIIALTKTLAWEAGPYGITVNCIAPGVTVAPEVEKIMGAEKVKALAAADPMQRLGTCEEVASMIVYLAGAGNWITGQLHTLRIYTE